MGLSTDERNVPDVVLQGVWRRMIETGAAQQFFYAGQVRTEQEWLRFIKSQHNLVVFVIDRDIQEIVLFGILNSVQNKTAQGHFCNVGPYKRGVGEAMLRFWAGMVDTEGVPLLSVVWGSTPASSRAVKLVEILGFTVLGTIPHMCNLKYEQKVVGATISYLDLEEYRHGR